MAKNRINHYYFYFAYSDLSQESLANIAETKVYHRSGVLVRDSPIRAIIPIEHNKVMLSFDETEELCNSTRTKFAM